MLLNWSRRHSTLVMLILMQRQGGHALLILTVVDLPLILFLDPLDILLLEVIIRQLDILNDLLDWFLLLAFGKSPRIEVLILHLPGDQLILEIPDILMVNLNNAADLFLEDPRQFLMVLVVLAQHENLTWELVFFVLPFEEFRVLVEEDLILEKRDVAVMIILVHLLYGLDVGRIVTVVAMPRKVRVKSRACHTQRK